ncbi:initiator RepB protein (plasmid) [Halobacillus litoralis]|uniref:Initiator RepB protein n=2 Tax=Halobacillus litoralis TaxID=45668 RepID=A0A410MJB2_9BACI|nr:initiator RepB protein [Halobacillus litoralis]
MSKHDADIMNNTVTKSNQLIEANYTSQLSEREQKIILYIVSKVQKDDEDFQTYTLSIGQFTNMMGLKRPKYEELKEITKRLLSKVIEIKREGGVLQTQWLSTAEYNEWQGTIDFTFHPKMKPFLLYLKKEFTSYKLINIMRLSGRYSIRIYELMKKWERLKKTEFSIQELRLMLGIQNKYNDYSNFRKRVLDPAKKELDEKTDISFDYEPLRKNGRSTSHIRFHIKKNQKNIPELLPDESHVINRLRENSMIKREIVKESTIHEWITWSKELWGEEFEQSLFSLVKHVESKNNINNPPGMIHVLLRDMKEEAESGMTIPPITLDESNEVIPQWFEQTKEESNVFEEPSNTTQEDLQERINRLTSNR